MQTFGLILFIITALAGTASLAYSIYLSINLVKNPQKHINLKEEFKKIIIFCLVFIVSFTLMMFAIYPWSKISAKWYEILQGLAGGFIFASSLSVGVNTFIIHYCKKELDKSVDKYLFRILMICIPIFVLSFFICTNGYADYWTYPLVNGISFSSGFVNPSNGSPNLAWYAICILSGAIFVYLLCDHKFYIQYGQHGILESVLLTGFPAGIIGARIGYVIGNWNVGGTSSFAYRVSHGDILSIIAIWEGGLTILGGAIGGILVGVLWFLWKKKQYNIWLAVDIIVPTILIAQAIGRWGNFFNCEVHGGLVDESYFQWLPRVIFQNAHYSKTYGWASEGKLFAPLFFIEGISNLLGYFVIAHLFGVKLRKYTELGDLAFAYPIWYGLTRLIMEPMRTEADVMGTKGYWSWFWSIAYVVIGILLIVGNHFIRHQLAKKKDNYTPKKSWFQPSLISSIIVVIISLSLIIVGSVLLSKTTPSDELLNLNQGNFGLVFLIFGITFLFILFISIPLLMESLKVRKQDEQI